MSSPNITPDEITAIAKLLTSFVDFFKSKSPKSAPPAIDLEKISQFQETLIRFRAEYASLQDKHIRQEDEIRKLHEQLAKRPRAIEHHGAVWKLLDSGNEDGPYCPNCFEVTGKFILPIRGMLIEGMVGYSCREHKSPFSFSPQWNLWMSCHPTNQDT